MGLNAIWLRGEERKTVLLALMPSILILASNHYAGYLHKFTENAHPKVLDLYLYSFDSSLHAPIAFWMGQAVRKWKTFGDVSFVFYVGLPFSLALVYAGQASRMRGKAIPIFVAFLLMGPIGGIFYNLFPALGPGASFWRSISVAAAGGGSGAAASPRAGADPRLAQRDSVAAHGLDADVVVVFARAFGL